MDKAVKNLILGMYFIPPEHSGGNCLFGGRGGCRCHYMCTNLLTKSLVRRLVEDLTGRLKGTQTNLKGQSGVGVMAELMYSPRNDLGWGKKHFNISRT